MIKTDIILELKYNTETVKSAISAALPVSADEISDIRIVKRALSVEEGRAPVYKTTVAFTVDPEREAGLLKMRKKVFSYEPLDYSPPPAPKMSFRPVVVGAGPAGLFAALTLAESGASPIILERGMAVEERSRRVNAFNTLGILDTECNVQFGEGGAGTYSDGKLKVGSMDKYKMKVLKEFISAGADASIAFSTSAHLGTDRLSLIVKRLRERIISKGGEFLFGARLTDLHINGDALSGITYVREGREEYIDTSALILAIGHSARDTIRMLRTKGLVMSAKGFGVGVRIEHPREYINGIVYKDSESYIEETASYHLVTHLKNGRSVYSFCMCPGGTVVAATGNNCSIVTNGMSEHDRMGINSNAAILVSVTPEDFASNDSLAGLAYQESIERRAYSLTERYRAPSERLGDFKRGRRTSSFGSVLPTYPRGTEFIEADSYLPSYVTESLRASVGDFNDWLCGFDYPDAVITGPETRTTSPVRIERDEWHRSLGFFGIYPAGEGAGYSGGIVSSATDGIRTAEKMILSCNAK